VEEVAVGKAMRKQREKKLTDILIRECNLASAKACVYGLRCRGTVPEGADIRINLPHRLEVIVQHVSVHSPESVAPIIRALRDGGFLR